MPEVLFQKALYLGELQGFEKHSQNQNLNWVGEGP